MSILIYCQIPSYIGRCYYASWFHSILIHLYEMTNILDTYSIILEEGPEVASAWLFLASWQPGSK